MKIYLQYIFLRFSFRDSDFDFFIQLSYVPLNAKPAEVIRKVKFILEQGKNFTNFEPIPNTRVPILKCNHIRTSMALDISFTSYGIWNSPIVAKLLTFDQRTSRTTRTYELSTILKFWGTVSYYSFLHFDTQLILSGLYF